MMGQLVDHPTGHSAGRRLGLTQQRPLDGEVLPDEDAEAIGFGVQLGAAHMSVDANEVEPGVGHSCDVGGDLLRGTVTDGEARGAERNPFQEHPAPVHRGDEVVELDGAQTGSPTAGVAWDPIDEDLDTDVVERLIAEGTGPPQRRIWDDDVELGAVLDLLVHDDANPRSLAFQLDRLREHMASLAWQEGADLVHAASLGALTLVDDHVAGGRRLSVDSLVLATRGPLLELGNAVVRRWFADPVNPMVMGSS